MVHIFVEDKNDNLPQFKSEQFFIGIPYDAKIGDVILDAEAHDPDVPNVAENEGITNQITYSIRTSNLYRSGETQSSGSLVPSRFEIDQTGIVGILRTNVVTVMEFHYQAYEIH